MEELTEMNRPKSADYFTWAYPDTSALGTPEESIKLENGVISMEYNIENSQMYGGCQTETRPGTGLGLDFSNYKVIKATLTNKGTSNVHCTLVFKTGSGWKWQENAGAKTPGGPENQEQIILQAQDFAINNLSQEVYAPKIMDVYDKVMSNKTN